MHHIHQALVETVCILAPRTVHEKDCSDIRTISTTTCLLLTPTMPPSSWRKGRDSIIIPPILFDSLPTAGFDCIRLFPPLAMNWDVCATPGLRLTVRIQDSSRYKRNTLRSPRLQHNRAEQCFPNHHQTLKHFGSRGHSEWVFKTVGTHFQSLQIGCQI